MKEEQNPRVSLVPFSPRYVSPVTQVTQPWSCPPRVEHAGLRAPCSGARFGDPGQRCGEGPVSAAARLRSGSFWSGSACHNADDTGASWSLERKSNGDGEGVTRALAPLCFGEELAYSPLGVGAELERGEVVQRCPGKQCPGGFAAPRFA